MPGASTILTLNQAAQNHITAFERDCDPGVEKEWVGQPRGDCPYKFHAQIQQRQRAIADLEGSRDQKQFSNASTANLYSQCCQ
jgi:hypothetical protein